MLRRERGGEANSGYSPTQDGSCPGEQAKERNTLFRQIHFPIQTNTFSYSDKYIFLFRQIHFPIQTNTISYSDKYISYLDKYIFLLRQIQTQIHSKNSFHTYQNKSAKKALKPMQWDIAAWHLLVIIVFDIKFCLCTFHCLTLNCSYCLTLYFACVCFIMLDFCLWLSYCLLPR